jgi:lysophospholipase L1-like esterase
MTRFAIPKLFRTIVFSLLPLVVLLLAVEITLRVASVDVNSTSRQFPINQDINFPDVYNLDRDLFWRFRPGRDVSSKRYSAVTYHINSMGFRGKEPRMDGEDLIVALGNSCTFGWAVREEYIWTTKLEHSLNESRTNESFQVINAGVPGYSSHQGRILCSDLVRNLKPQYLLIMYGWNDHWTAGTGGVDRDVEMPHRYALKAINLLAPLKSFQLLRKLADNTSEQSPEVTINTLEGARRVPIEQFRENLSAIVDSARKYSAVPILIVPPISPLSVTTRELQSIHREYQQIIREVAHSLDVRCVDLQPAFDSAGNLFTDKNDPVHFGVEGHELVATKLREAIKTAENKRDSAFSR